MTSTAVLAVSGALGFLIVALGFPDWQVAVESAQVVGGLVEYPRDNSFFIYHMKLWTVLHQVCASLLRAGMSEITLSTLLTGVQGMLTFQALAMFVYAISRDGVLALASVVVIIASGTADAGATYPIFLLGTSHTYGAMGLSLVVLAAALIGAGRHRLGLFLVGLSPAVHPSLGLWLGIIVALAFALDVRSARRILLDGWRAFAAGAAVTTLSLGVHLAMAPDVPALPGEVSARYLSAFTALWDEHRQPVAFDRAAVPMSAAALVLAVAWGSVRRDLFLPRFVGVTAAIGLAFAAASWIPPDRLPRPIVMLMPARLLNVTAMTFTALLVGIARALPPPWPWLTVVTSFAVLAGSRSLLWGWIRQRGGADLEPLSIPSWGVLAVVTLLVLAVLSVPRIRKSAAAMAHAHVAGGSIAVLAMALIVAWIAAGPVRATDRGSTVFRDRTNDLVFQAAARGRGMLLTGGDLFLIQLRTRRPVLLNGGALDSLPYALDSAPAMDRVLRDVYGIDLFNPPPGTPRRAVIPVEYNRHRWQGYPLDRWQQIKREYNVTQVMVPSDWALQLPIAAHTRQYLLYDIP